MRIKVVRDLLNAAHDVDEAADNTLLWDEVLFAKNLKAIASDKQRSRDLYKALSDLRMAVTKFEELEL